MNRFQPRQLRLALIPVVAALAVACASVPASNPMLSEARALYQQAANDASVARSAPLELSRAQASLQKAESALKAGEDVDLVEHHAYLARQQAAVAMQAGQIARSQATVSGARAQRDRILMDSRSREAQVQALAAEKSRAEAEMAMKRAQDASKLAEERLAAAEAAKAKNSSLQAQLAELQAKQTDRGMVLTLGDVLFDTGRAQLKPGAMRTIDRLATFMRDNPERTVAVEGYTDSVGGEAYNQQLSQRRAEAVQTALTGRGIASNRVNTTGFGEASPVASNNTAEGRQRNRRVEVVISGTQ
ncbi:OmpA family protein [Hydrogenophaga sp.]|uniref:OmpA family protein n=1 Tax=Hydrogenophaga sp. TaxID=1904254 RepID=UPI003569947F